MRYRPTVAEINGYALAHNVKEFVRLAGNAKLMAVVKADAYGHGAPMCARIALAHGAAAGAGGPGGGGPGWGGGGGAAGGAGGGAGPPPPGFPPPPAGASPPF